MKTCGNLKTEKEGQGSRMWKGGELPHPSLAENSPHPFIKPRMPLTSPSGQESPLSGNVFTDILRLAMVPAICPHVMHLRCYVKLFTETFAPGHGVCHVSTWESCRLCCYPFRKTYCVWPWPLPFTHAEKPVRCFVIFSCRCFAHSHDLRAEPWPLPFTHAENVSVL